jgi:hypothetical protein
MLRFVFKLVTVLLTLSAALIFGMRGRTADQSTVSSLLLPAAECAAACWQGIEIGVTTRDEAAALLAAHPWVEQVYQTSVAVTWRWNGSQPALYNGARDGLLQIVGGVVEQIRIPTLIPFGDVWLLLDRPERAQLVRTFSRNTSYQIAHYRVGIQAISAIACPLTPEKFWTATITLGMGEIWSTEALDSENVDLYHAPAWWLRLGDC